MKRDVKKLFAQPGKNKIVATVQKSKGRTHSVTDDRGRKYKVDSEVVYRPGTRVIVMNGVIVARAAAGKEPKIIEV